MFHLCTSPSALYSIEIIYNLYHLFFRGDLVNCNCNPAPPMARAGPHCSSLRLLSIVFTSVLFGSYSFSSSNQ